MDEWYSNAAFVGALEKTTLLLKLSLESNDDFS